jgi:hypothetical protein
MTLEEQAHRIGHHIWLETRLFEVLGGWITVVSEPEAKVCLASHSRHHAWHAELWHKQLPAVPHLPADQLVAPAHAQLAAALGVLAGAETDGGGAEPDSGDGTLTRLVGMYRVVVPRVITAYRRDLESASPISDAPMLHTLRHLLSDEIEDWREGEQLIQSLARTSEAVDRAGAHQARIEKLIAGG